MTKESIKGKPLVDILILTYNQENYIAEAIESVLIQKTDFNYKIIIGDDCSTDRTREICLNYKNKFPDKIDLVFHEKNLGAVKNFYVTYQSCDAKYLAMLDGDDYWTSTLKLQKQVNILENNSDYSACFHPVHYLTLNETENQIFPINVKKNILKIEDVIELPTTGWIIMTSSVIYKKQALGVLPKWFINFKLGDWSLVLLASQNGKIYFLNDVLGAYRINSSSLMQTAFTNETVIKTIINIFKEFNKHTKYQFRKSIYKQLQYLLFQLLNYNKEKKQWCEYYINKIKYNSYSVLINYEGNGTFKDFVLLCFNYIKFLPRKVN